jgi:hypothetical protein
MSNGQAWEFERRSQLRRLVQTLGDVLAILRLDRSCAWTGQFEDCLRISERLLNTRFTQADLVDLAHLVGGIVDHTSGFPQYRPPDCTMDPENWTSG